MFPLLEDAKREKWDTENIMPQNMVRYPIYLGNALKVYWPEKADVPRLLGFMGYKAGMTYAMVIEDRKRSALHIGTAFYIH